MGMVQLQARTKNGGKQEHKSGGSGRVDANDESCVAGRAPREEGAVATRVGATTETAAKGKRPATAAERRMDQDLPMTQAEDQRFRLA